MVVHCPTVLGLFIGSSTEPDEAAPLALQQLWHHLMVIWLPLRVTGNDDVAKCASLSHVKLVVMPETY